MSDKIVIETEGLTKNYDGVTVVDHLNLHIRERRQWDFNSMRTVVQWALWAVAFALGLWMGRMGVESSAPGVATVETGRPAAAEVAIAREQFGATRPMPGPKPEARLPMAIRSRQGDLSAIAALPQGRMRDRGIMKWIAEVPSGQLGEALHWDYSAFRTDELRWIKTYLVRRWAEHDPGAALEYITDIAPLDPAVIPQEIRAEYSFPEYAMRQLQQFSYKDDCMYLWAERDPAAAIAWLRSSPKADDFMWSKAIVAVAHQDPHRAMALLEEELGGWTGREGTFSQVMAIWSRREPGQAATEFFSAMAASDGGAFRFNPAYRVVLHHWLRSDGDYAVEWIASQMPAHVLNSPSFQGALVNLASPRSWQQWEDPNERTGMPDWAMRLVDAIPSPQTRKDAWRSVFDSWAAQHLDEAREWLADHPDSPYRLEGEMVLAAQVGGSDPAAGASRVADLLRDGDFASLHPYSIPYHVWTWAGSGDPYAALESVQAIAQPQAYYRALQSVYAGWAQLDPAAAAAAAASLAGPERIYIQRDIVETWLDQDPAAAMAWLEAAANPLLTQAVIQGPLGTMAKEHPESTKELVSLLPEGRARSEAIAEVAKHLQPLAQALDWLTALPPGPSRDAGFDALSTSWAKEDPDAVAAFALALPPGTTRAMLLQEAGKVWSNLHPEDALTRAAALLEDADGDSDAGLDLTEQIIRRWAGQDPKAAAAYVADLGESGLQERAILDIASAWAGADPADALAWVGEFHASPGRDEALKTVFSSWAGPDLSAAMEEVLELPSAQQSPAVSAVLPILVRQDPMQAMEWTRDLAAGQQSTAQEQLMAEWSRNDVSAASAYLEKMPPGVQQTEATIAFVRSAAAMDPELAWGHAVTIADPDLRAELLRLTGRAWAANDRQAAEQAMEDAGLNEEGRNAIRVPME